MTGLTVRAIRLYYGLTQREFAKLLGVSYSTIGAIESGRRKVTKNMRIKIAQTFDLTDEVIAAIERAHKVVKLTVDEEVVKDDCKTQYGRLNLAI